MNNITEQYIMESIMRSKQALDDRLRRQILADRSAAKLAKARRQLYQENRFLDSMDWSADDLLRQEG